MIDSNNNLYIIYFIFENIKDVLHLFALFITSTHSCIIISLYCCFLTISLFCWSNNKNSSTLSKLYSSLRKLPFNILSLTFFGSISCKFCPVILWYLLFSYNTLNFTLWFLFQSILFWILFISPHSYRFCVYTSKTT